MKTVDKIDKMISEVGTPTLSKESQAAADKFYKKILPMIDKIVGKQEYTYRTMFLSRLSWKLNNPDMKG